MENLLELLETLIVIHGEVHDSTVEDEENQNCEVCRIIWKNQKSVTL